MYIFATKKLWEKFYRACACRLKRVARSKPFSTTLIGSMPRSRELLKLKEKSIEDKTYLNEYRKKLFSETEEVVHMLEDTGIDVVIDRKSTV